MHVTFSDQPGMHVNMLCCLMCRTMKMCMLPLRIAGIVLIFFCRLIQRLAVVLKIFPSGEQRPLPPLGVLHEISWQQSLVSD